MDSNSIIHLADVLVKSSAGRPEAYYVKEFAWAVAHLKLGVTEDMSWEKILDVLATIHTLLEGQSKSEWGSLTAHAIQQKKIGGSDDATIEYIN